MKTISKRILVLFVSLFILGVSIDAFAFLGFGTTAKWNEEVLLNEGSRIIMERWQKHGGRHALDQEPDVSDQWIRFTIPGTKRIIKWTDEYSEDVG